MPRKSKLRYLLANTVFGKNKNMTKRKTFTEQLREAIEKTPVTRYRISQDTGIAEGVLSRFVRGQVGLSVASINTLVEYLNLELVQRKRKGR